MHVFVSWASLLRAEQADDERKTQLKQVAKSEQEEDKELAAALTQKNCLPEFYEYSTLPAAKEATVPKLDTFNSDILAVRFIVPGLSEIKTYKLAGRLDGSKLPVALAARAFLINNFGSEWVSDVNSVDGGKITFVGLPGLHKFMTQFAFACGALGEALPVDLWNRSQRVEIAEDEATVKTLVEACAFNQKTEEERRKYTNLLAGWLGVGTSAERDGDVLITAALKLGFIGPATRS